MAAVRSVAQSVSAAFRMYKADIREYVNGCEAGRIFWDEECGPRWWLWLEGTYEITKGLLMAQWCKFAGHKWQDCGSYANGDSAVDHLYCVRCGKDVKHIWY
jgi:hypothetical protein